MLVLCVTLNQGLDPSGFREPHLSSGAGLCDLGTLFWSRHSGMQEAGPLAAEEIKGSLPRGALQLPAL